MFEDEGDLEFYKKYTRANCRFECGIKKAEKEFGCIPWFLPHGDNADICDPWIARNFSKKAGRIFASSQHCQDCIQDCEITESSASISSEKFRC